MLDRRVWNWPASYSGRIQSRRKINRQKSIVETGTNEVSLNTVCSDKNVGINFHCLSNNLI